MEAEMKIIVVISPDFLESAFKETQDFSFCMQGYGNFNLANDRLMYTNAQDILGFAYVCSELPKHSSKVYKSMLKFFDNCNLMQANLKFVIVTQDELSNRLVKDLKRFKFLRFSYHESVEFITDTVLRRDVFGSILIDVYEPYEMKPREQPDLTKFVCPRLMFAPIVPTTLFLVESTIHPLDTLKDTIDNDVVIVKYSENEIIVLLREIFIMKQFGGDYWKLADRLRRKSLELDDKMMGICLGFLEKILEGGDEPE